MRDYTVSDWLEAIAGFTLMLAWLGFGCLTFSAPWTLPAFPADMPRAAAWLVCLMWLVCLAVYFGLTGVFLRGIRERMK